MRVAAMDPTGLARPEGVARHEHAIGLELEEDTVTCTRIPLGLLTDLGLGDGVMDLHHTVEPIASLDTILLARAHAVGDYGGGNPPATPPSSPSTSTTPSPSSPASRSIRGPSGS